MKTTLYAYLIIYVKTDQNLVLFGHGKTTL